MKCNTCIYKKHYSHVNKQGIKIDNLSYDYCEKFHWHGDPFDLRKPYKMFIDPMKNCINYKEKIL